MPVSIQLQAQAHTGHFAMPLSDAQIAAVVFNETRSLSGNDIQRARANVAHTIVNADSSSGGRPRSAPTTANVPAVEQSAYADCLAAVQLMRREKAQGTDPTNGAKNFNFRKNASRSNFYGFAIQTQVGPLNNSYPTADLPRSGIYANTYGN